MIAGRYGDASRFSDRMSDELDDLRLLCDSGDVIVISTRETGATSNCACSASTDPADTSHTDPSWHPAAINSSRREESACDVGRPRKRVTRVGFERQKLDGPGASRCTPKPNEVSEAIVRASRLSRPTNLVEQAWVRAHFRCLALAALHRPPRRHHHKAGPFVIQIKARLRLHGFDRFDQRTTLGAVVERDRTTDTVTNACLVLQSARVSRGDRFALDASALTLKLSCLAEHWNWNV